MLITLTFSAILNIIARFYAISWHLKPINSHKNNIFKTFNPKNGNIDLGHKELVSLWLFAFFKIFLKSSNFNKGFGNIYRYHK